jgi:hypothetical protein
MKAVELVLNEVLSPRGRDPLYADPKDSYTADKVLALELGAARCGAGRTRRAATLQAACSSSYGHGSRSETGKTLTKHISHIISASTIFSQQYHAFIGYPHHIAMLDVCLL